MLLPMLLLHSLAVPAAPAAARGVAADPPVKVWFSSDGKYRFGDRAKVYAKTAEDGYLVVLRADAGRVRASSNGCTVTGSTSITTWRPVPSHPSRVTSGGPMRPIPGRVGGTPGTVRG